jgi:hypothetical protein
LAEFDQTGESEAAALKKVLRGGISVADRHQGNGVIILAAGKSAVQPQPRWLGMAAAWEKIFSLATAKYGAPSSLPPSGHIEWGGEPFSHRFEKERCGHFAALYPAHAVGNQEDM